MAEASARLWKKQHRSCPRPCCQRPPCQRPPCQRPRCRLRLWRTGAGRSRGRDLQSPSLLSSRSGILRRKMSYQIRLSLQQLLKTHKKGCHDASSIVCVYLHNVPANMSKSFASFLDKGQSLAKMFGPSGTLLDPRVVRLSGMFRLPLCQLFHNVSVPTAHCHNCQGEKKRLITFLTNIFPCSARGICLSFVRI